MWRGEFDFNCDLRRGRKRQDWPFGEWMWGGRRRRGPMGGRMFEQGDLKYVILQLLAEKPRHGYEIIKALEEKSGGMYAPSAGAIYPTLTMLEDMGFAQSVQEEGGKKVYTITDAGRAHLEENRSTVDDVFDRIGEIGAYVFSDQMREIGKVFTHIVGATLGAAPSHMRDSETSRRVLEVLQRASREIDDILRGPRAGGTEASGETGSGASTTV